MFELDLARRTEAAGRPGRLSTVAAIASRSGERNGDWLAAFESAGVPAVEPVARSTHAFLNDPENRRTGRVAECHHPTRGNVRELAQLVRVSGSTDPPHRLAPDLGAHTESILRAMGRPPEEIADLRDAGAIRP